MAAARSMSKNEESEAAADESSEIDGSDDDESQIGPQSESAK